MLTNEEKLVIELVTKSKNNAEIAKELKLSAESVKKYLKSAYKKLNVHNRIQAMIVCLK